MSDKQRTLKEKISFSGIGLHTGAMVNMTIHPAPVNHWFIFKRIDVEGSPIIKADVNNVVDTSRGTVLQQNGVRVHTTEHILSALVGMGIDNAIIELDGPEIPILDGSAQRFVAEIERVGVVEQNLNKNYFVVEEAIEYSSEEKNIELAALPFNNYRLTVMVDYNSKVIASQHAILHNLDNYKEKISPCRTFVFVHEIEQLFKNGLIKGGDLNNAIVISEDGVDEERAAYLSNLLSKDNIQVSKPGILNQEPLKFNNEPARHKLLDLIGDLALVGRPLKAHILAARPGHSANVELAKAIKKTIEQSNEDLPQYDVEAEPVFNVTDIAKFLPHRYPFQLVDKIVSLDGTSVVGIKNVTMNEPQFTGHFPDNPVFPGVLLLEAIAQTGGVLVLTSTGEPEKYWPYLVGIDNSRFYKNIVPGDTIVMKCTLSAPIRMGVAKMHGDAYVGKKRVCSVDMIARLVKKS
jgi:UDP-3-O-[3-hydroxymyristoyl] N-acetylglucosamine deacetylase/3-hydroxyacyl-[acyl-carrier-protein] dehydratase